MGNGRYCEKHGEWAPDGQCRWCEPVQELEHAANCQPCMAAQTAQVPVTLPAADCYTGERDSVSPGNAILSALRRRERLAEIGRAFYAAIRRQQETKAPVYNFSDALELCDKLTASEAKPFAPVCEHPLADRVNVVSHNGTVCGRCGMVL